MRQEGLLLKQIKTVVLYAIIFLFPLFFLPVTQEFFSTGKMYFLFFGALVLLLITTFEFLLTKKIEWAKKPFDNVMVLFFITAVLSVIISSPNKVQALLNPGYGIVTLFSYLMLYFFISRETNTVLKYTLVYVSSIIVALVSLFFFFYPLKNVALPAALQFLKNPYFSLQGNVLDTVLVLGFTATLAFSHLFSKKNDLGKQALPLVALILSLTAIALNVFSFVKVKDLLVLPPFNLSWYATVETLKNPLSALFGVGIDNYSSMFTRIKDAGYNTSSLWQVGSFNAAASTVLHVFTEMGVVGGIALLLILFQVAKTGLGLRKHAATKYDVLPVLYVIVALVFFPPSITVFFLLLLAVTNTKNESAPEPFTLETGNILPLYAAMLVVTFAFIGLTGFFGGRALAAEISFKEALNGFAKNNIKTVYDNMRQAVLTDPYIERFHTNFSQTNLLIANNVASKAQVDSSNLSNSSNSTNTNKLSDQDRQTISQALQAAIEEAKAAVTLNPQKATNWEGLAAIYRNIINVAQGADSWTVSAYQRAIVLDPQNPSYRVALGGVLFSLKNYDEASKLFEQAVSIKPDWANSYYNLAWASFQKQDYQKAVIAMQSTLSLLDPKKDGADYQKATVDLEEFKKKLPSQNETATSSAQIKQSKLSVPTPAVQTLEPKIKLPKEASPEAK